MKKRTVIIVCVLILVLLGSVTVLAIGVVRDPAFLNFFNKSKELRTNDVVLVKVNGEEIYESEVETEQEFSKLSYSLALSQIDDMEIDESTKFFLKNQQKEMLKTKEEIIDNIIRDILLLQEAKRQGVTISLEEARRFAVEQYTILKELAATSGSSVDKKNYEFILLYMKEMNMTEEQYIDSTVEKYRKILIINKLYEMQQKVDNIAINDEGFSEEYVETLFQNAEIVYMKKG